MPKRSASTSWLWIVSKLTWRASTKSSSASSGYASSALLTIRRTESSTKRGVQMRVLDDEELVGPLQELVDRRAHRALDDLDELLGVEPAARAEVEEPAAALVVRRERHQLEDPLDVHVREAGLAEPLGRLLADEPLRARAGVDAGRLDAHDPS